MKTIGIIPARFSSNRLPGKPLLDIGGKPMIQRVYEQALKASKIDYVLIATDDARIESVAKGFGADVCMTKPELLSGTDRIAAALQQLEEAFDFVINIQGDEPFIDPLHLDTLVKSMKTTNAATISTLACVISEPDHLFEPNVVKVVLSESGRGLYFSRQAIPYLRNFPKEEWLQKQPFYQHLGVYGFQSDVLLKLVQLPQSELEKVESLEQLRWLSNGFNIHVQVVEKSGFGIDTQDDLNRARELFK